MTGESPPRPTRVMLVEDHDSFRQALAFMLDLEPDFVVVYQTGTLAGARAAQEAADLAVVDLALPDGNGADLIADLRRANPEVKVLILSATLDESSRRRVVEMGAERVLDKLTGVDEIIAEVRRLSAEDQISGGRPSA